MKKTILLSVLFLFITSLGFSQNDNYWDSFKGNSSALTKDKAVARQAFPKIFKLYDLNLSAMKQELFKVVGNAQRHNTIISLPNADGVIEQFEVVEASNFEPQLQAQFPEIRAFSGKGITDKSAFLKLSYSPQGIQTMVFRTNGPNEYIEPYSADHTTYAVFKSQRQKGALPWVCSTPDQELAAGLQNQVNNAILPESDAGQLKTMRLAQSCNGEYSNFFGATSSAQVALVLAAYNATLTRCNGCYEKDFALHLNLIPTTTDVIFYDPNTDPYTSMGSWNTQLMNTLHTIIGDDNFDIGHMFGASGGGGNAGCIGCVCNNTLSVGGGANNSYKGAGITSPADGIPQGDNFDIDYVAHEVGHQLGGNHTFSHGLEGTGVNKEIGSGITIMGYAGITPYDVAPHSIDIFHEATIQQVQVNLAGKTCPITTSLAGTNATPVVAPVASYTIPKSTPFALTGSATDADAADVLTYCWEQNDNSTVSGANSVASPTKVSGPNWLSFPATTSPVRYFPKLSTILAGQFITGPLPGGDPGANIEALSSVARTLNFRLTVRDNHPYSSTAPIAVGQTAYTDMVVTVDAATGPFKVTVPNTAVTYPAGSTQTITWDVAGTNGSPINCANVKILLSTDGGQTFPTVLVASTANDGSEAVTMPMTQSTTARIKIESIGNIFFDIDDANFTISAPFAVSSANGAAACFGAGSLAANINAVGYGGFNSPLTLSASGNPAGTTLSFSTNPVNPGSSSVLTMNNTASVAQGTYNITVTATSGSNSYSTTVPFVIGTSPAITAQPTNMSACAGGSVDFTTTATGAGLTYQWQVSTTGCSGTFTDIAGATAATYTVASPTVAMNGYAYRVVVSGACAPSVTSNCATLTVVAATTVVQQPVNQSGCDGGTATFSALAAGPGLTYVWQFSSDGGTTFINMAGANSPTLTLNPVTLAMNGYKYRVRVIGTCGYAESNSATLSVSVPAAISAQPIDKSTCNGTSVTFNASASGVGLTYQWQVSTTGCSGTFTNITGATSTSYTVANPSTSMNGYAYRLVVSSGCGTNITSGCALLTVYTVAVVNTQPVAQTVCVGNNATFSVGASGSGLGYQWQVSTNGGTSYTNISGATSATYSFAPTLAQSGNMYQVLVSSTCSATATPSSAVTLTVNDPVNITTAPVAVKGCSGGTATFTAAATGTGASYQWQVSTGGGAYANIAGANSANYTINNLSTAQNGNMYQVVVSGACGAKTSTPVSLNVADAPTVTLTANKSTVMPGSPAVLTANAAPAGTYSYQWYYNNALIAGYNGSTKTVTVDSLGTYKVVVTNATTTCSATSANVTITPEASGQLFIYPNPNNGVFQVRYYDAQMNAKRTLNIYDYKGAIVYKKEVTNTMAYQKIAVNISNQSSGIYYVDLRDASGNRLAVGRVKVVGTK